MSVKWLMELIDKVSPPAKAVSKSLEHVDQAVEKVDAHSKHAQGALDQLGHHIDAANKKAGKEFLEGVAEKFALFNVGAQLAERFTETLVELGSELVRDAVHAANFGRETNIVFTALTGSAEKAGELTEYMEKFADAAGLPIPKVRDLVNTLQRAGFKDDQLNIVMNAAVDVSALTFGEQSAKSFTDAFLDLEEKQQLTSRGLMQFKDLLLTTGGYDKLAAKLGFTTHGFHELQKQLELTPASARKAEQALIDIVQETSGGKLGAIQEKLGHELPGTFQKFENHLEELLGTVGKSAAWEKLLSFVDQVQASFAPGTEGSKQLQSALSEVLVGVEDLLEKVSRPGVLDGFITKLTDFAHSAATVANAVIAVTEGIAELIGYWNDVPGPLRSFLSNPLTAAPRAVGDWLAGVVGRGGAASYDSSLYGHSEQFYKHGGEDDASAMSVAGTDAFNGLEDGFRKAGDSHSPSRVMMDVGRDAFEGLRLGASEGRGGGASSGPARLSVNLVVNVHGGGGSGAEEQGRIAGRAALAELQPAFDTLAEQLGLAS